jgi:3-hydroxybutyryl-CoA dehydrogenase
VLYALEALHEEYPAGRYAPSQALRRLAVAQEEQDEHGEDDAS